MNFQNLGNILEKNKEKLPFAMNLLPEICKNCSECDRYQYPIFKHFIDTSFTKHSVLSGHSFPFKLQVLS